MTKFRGLTRFVGWPLVVVFGCGIFSFAGFVYAAYRMKSGRWTFLAVSTSVLTLIGWILISAWQFNGVTADGATAYVLEMWIAFIAMAWVVNDDYDHPAWGFAGPPWLSNFNWDWIRFRRY